jgi:hypothetical protein
MAAAVVDASADRTRAFTLPELVELLPSVPAPSVDDPIARARELVRGAHALRDGLPPPALLPEVPDPWGATEAVYRATGTRVTELSRRLVTLLFGMPEGRGAKEGS